MNNPIICPRTNSYIQMYPNLFILSKYIHILEYTQVHKYSNTDLFKNKIIIIQFYKKSPRHLTEGVFVGSLNDATQIDKEK